MRNVARSIKTVFVLLCLMTGTACSYDPLTITGEVVDESGNALSGVSVWACYSGWGWAEDVGYLVWDKDTCSETVQTDIGGLYFIAFEGPVSSRLTARKEGWTQAGSFHATNSRIVMTRMEDYSARLRDEAKERALEHCRRQAVETDTGYYCRVVLPEVRSVNLNYQDESIVVVPTILKGESQTEAMFAVQGSLSVVNDFSKEAVLMVNGEAQDLSFSAKLGESDCGQEVRFLEFREPGLDAWEDTKIELFVPSIKAMFGVNLHACSAE